MERGKGQDGPAEQGHVARGLEAQGPRGGGVGSGPAVGEPAGDEDAERGGGGGGWGEGEEEGVAGGGAAGAPPGEIGVAQEGAGEAAEALGGWGGWEGGWGVSMCGMGRVARPAAVFVLGVAHLRAWRGARPRKRAGPGSGSAACRMPAEGQRKREWNGVARVRVCACTRGVCVFVCV